MADPLRVLREDLSAFAGAIERPLASWQADGLRLKARMTVIVAPRQSGKSRAMATLALWWAFTRPGSLVLVVSAGEDASKRLLAEAASGALHPLLAGSVTDENSGLLTLSNGSEIRSVPASERAVRGWTVDLLLVDEAAQVDDDLLLGAALPTTAARPDARVVLASSPGPPEGSFYGFAEQGQDGLEHTETFTWRLDDAEWIEPAVIAAAREQLPPAAFAREYEGRFSDVGSEERVIEREWIVQAQHRTLEAGALLFGVDIARAGGDETVAVAMRGGVARVAWANRGADLMVTSGRIAAMVGDEPGPVWLDAIGLGYGVYDRLRELGIAVSPFVASARSSRPERFLNLRAEAWWAAREAFRLGEVDLDLDDRVLAAQLGSVRYALASNGSIQIQAKVKVKTSPDRADALVIALYARGQQARAETWERLAREAGSGPVDPLLRDAAGGGWMGRTW